MSWSRLISGIVLGGWISAAAAGTPSDPTLFADGFERGSTDAWTNAVGGD